MKKQKPKPEPKYNPYELHPPLECWMCGDPIKDFRDLRRFFGHSVCRKCTMKKGAGNALNNI